MNIVLSSVMFRSQVDELGIGYITSVLRDNGHFVKLIAVNQSDVDNYTAEDYLNQIIDFKPKILGMCVYDASLQSTIKVCNYLKDKIKDIKICLGGVSATISAHDILHENNCIDYVVRGEGEIPFLNLVEHVENNEDLNNMKGLVYRKENVVVTSEIQEYIQNLDKLPFPSRDLFETFYSKQLLISTSRGCYGRCSFCATASACKFNQGSVWRGRSIENVLEEIELLYNKYKCRRFQIIDCSYEFPKIDRMMEIAKELIDRKLDIYYNVNFRADLYKKISNEQMQLLRKSGLYEAFVGIEAGNEFDLRLYGKSLSLESNNAMINFLKKNEINLVYGFININPYSTLENINKNIDFLHKNQCLSLQAYLSVYFIIKETELYRKLEKDNLINENSEYGYNFVDPKVERFTSFFKKIVQKHKNYDVLNYYSSYYLDNLSLVKFILESKENEQINKKMKNTINYVKDKIIELDFHGMYKKLLNCNNHLYEDAAMKIFNEYFDENRTNKIISDIQSETNRLIKFLMINKSLEKEILSLLGV